MRIDRILAVSLVKPMQHPASIISDATTVSRSLAETRADRLLWIAGLVLVLLGLAVMMSGIAPGLSGPILIVIEVGIFFLLYRILRVLELIAAKQ